jgi:uncharacterized membrane protein YphA (DoxX/SURF4 family)
MYALLRFVVGAVLFINGAQAFANSSGGLPTHPAPYLAALLGLALVVGVATRRALWGGMLFVLGMLVDRGYHKDWAGLQPQIIYAGLFYLLYANLAHNRWAVDGWFAAALAPPAQSAAANAKTATAEPVLPVYRPALAPTAAQDGAMRTPIDTALPSPSVVVADHAAEPAVDGARTTILQLPAEMNGASDAMTAAPAAPAADTGAPAPDSPGVMALQGATKLLAMHIGPFARIVSRNVQSELGISAGALTKTQFEGFVVKMSGQVADAAKKEQFLSNANQLGGTLG